VLAAHGKELGRDWFPLAGSLGSDAQALPAGSRTPQLCSLCLLAVQLLPLGVTLLHGKLACFQSTSWEMTQQLAEYSYYEMQAMLAATASNERLAALGAKGGTTPTTMRLLQLLGHLRESRRMLALPVHVTMNIWLFSNSGTGADCDLCEILMSGHIF
jgi:CRISPR-associated protein (Cas_CXXC_CXXC)